MDLRGNEVAASTDEPRRVWHVGFIVDDLETAMAELTGGLGISWLDIRTIANEEHQRPGRTPYRITTRVVRSVELPMSIELMEPVPGTHHTPRGGHAFNHIGYWTDDMEAEEVRLSQLGMPCLGFSIDPSGVRRNSFHEGPFGALIEACNASLPRPGLEQFRPGGVVQ
jgi:hypothetical protein